MTVLIIGVTIAIITLYAQGKKDLTIFRQEAATPIKEGVMTEKQREHSKLIKGEPYISGKKIADLIAKQGDVEVYGPIQNVPLPHLSTDEVLTYLKCNANSVIIGRVISKSSNLIGTGTFVFTDYEVTIEDVLKDNSDSPLSVGSNITITRLGGTISLNGHIVRAIDETSAPLTIGNNYLFYLKYVPTTGAYRPLAHPAFDDTFHLLNSEVSQVSNKKSPFGWHDKANAISFLTEARNVLNSPCRFGEGN
jgi:hypothetical protein